MSVKKFKDFSSKELGDNIFVRWGGANAVRQKGEWKGGKGGWHSPPDSRGIYAFPIRGIERFLSAHRMKERYSRIKYQDELWHHLEEHVKPKDVLKRQGSWVLTTFKVWEKAFTKELLRMKLESWEGDINKNQDDVGKETTYWHYIMRKLYPYVNKDNCSSTDPVLDARFKRFVNRQAPTKDDLNEPEYVKLSHLGDETSFTYSYREWLDDYKGGNSRGHFSGDHLEVFLPNVK